MSLVITINGSSALKTDLGRFECPSVNKKREPRDDGATGLRARPALLLLQPWSAHPDGIIVYVEPTTALRNKEVHSARTMLERVEDRIGFKPERFIGRASPDGALPPS